MPYFPRKISLLLTVMIFVVVTPFKAHAVDIVDSVKVRPTAEGYEITLNFLVQLRHLASTNGSKTNDVQIQMQALNFSALTSDELTLLGDTGPVVSWNRRKGAPIEDIRYDGSDPQRPLIYFLFSQEVYVKVKSSPDLRSLIVNIKTDTKPAIAEPKDEEARNEHEDVVLPAPKSDEPLIDEEFKEDTPVSDAFSAEEVKSGDPEKDHLFSNAEMAIKQQDYDKAIQLYTKLVNIAQGAMKKRSQEMLGLAREKNKQFAHAKAEYEKYLQDYPQGADSDRVRQRLAGLITATKKPKARLAEGEVSDKDGEEKTADAEAEEEEEWESRYSANISQIYFFDKIRTGGESQISRSDLDTDLDMDGRWSNEKYDIRAKYAGGYLYQFRAGEADDDRLSRLNIQTKYKDLGFLWKLGRQTQTSGGVLGRFDGLFTSYEQSDKVKINAVVGLPVDSSSDVDVPTERRFAGMSLDLGKFDNKWDFNIFAIAQNNQGTTDRRAVGGEVRYFDDKKTFFSLLDYDVHFMDLNILLLNFSWNIDEDNTLTVLFDRRKSPLLTTGNAILGQGVNSLSDLYDDFTEEELRKLAEDRTAVSTTGTIGISHDINEKMQVFADVTVSELTGTPASAGVEEAPGTGYEFFYNLQLITNDNFLENDSIIYGARYSDAQNSDTYTLTLNSRFPFSRDFRLSPKLRLDYRTEKDSSDHRFKTRPTLSVNYNVSKHVSLEAEAGGELTRETSAGEKQSTQELFAMMGYRANF